MMAVTKNANTRTLEGHLGTDLDRISRHAFRDPNRIAGTFAGLRATASRSATCFERDD
jgi:hypothetical protein